MQADGVAQREPGGDLALEQGGHAGINAVAEHRCDADVDGGLQQGRAVVAEGIEMNVGVDEAAQHGGHGKAGSVGADNAPNVDSGAAV